MEAALVTSRRTQMDLAYVEKLVRLIEASEVHEIEIEEDGKKIRVSKSVNNVPQMYQSGTQPPSPVAQPGPPAAQLHEEPPALPSPQREQASIAPPPPGPKLHEIKSPIVGTFYSSPAPDAPPFVQVGSTIQPGSVLCIVEAMKLMNEIEADVSGKIARIMVETGQPVEYAQTLFLVEPL